MADRKISAIIIILLYFLGVGCEVVVNPEVVVQVNSVAFDFGVVDVGDYTDETLIITNAGDNPLVFFDLEFQNYGSGTTAEEFSFVSGWTGN